MKICTLQRLAATALVVALVASTGKPAAAAITTFDSFTVGSVNGQGGWRSTGPFDHAVVDLGGGNKALRISNAVTAGSFGDMTFSAPSGTPSGEFGAVGAVTNRFFASFDIQSATGGPQSGLFMSVSPDAGDGSRMSYLSVTDNGSGLALVFGDFQGADFVYTSLATLSYGDVHNIAFDMTLVDGPGDDIVNILINGSLVHTGTTWEDYYPAFQPAHDSPFAVDELLFRTAGTAAPGTLGNGFLIDNVIVADVNPAVPEPASMLVWSLFGVAAAGAGWRRRRLAKA